MKTNKSWWVLLAALGAAPLFLAGCGDDDDDTVGGEGEGEGGEGEGEGGEGEGEGGEGEGENPPPPELGAQIDRMGRPAVNTALIGFPLADEERGARRDEYNADSDPAAWTANWTAEIAGNLAVIDGLDRVCGNQPLFDGTEDLPLDGYTLLATILSDDQLYLNSTAPNDGGVYLGYEVDVGGLTPERLDQTGGRTLTADVIATSYTVLAAGALDGSIDDGITEDSLPNHTGEFPFVGPPHPAE